MSTYRVTVTIPVSGLTDKADAESFAEAMLEHLAETFNDDESLGMEHATFHVKQQGGK